MLGHAIVLGYIGIGIACTLLLMFLLRRENHARERGEVRRFHASDHMTSNPS